MRSALLRGSDQLGLGRIACIAEGRAAIAMSQGGARKRYAHKHPNEDAAALCLGAGGCLLVVADGHAGAEAAEAAVEEIIRTCGPGWTELRPPGDWTPLARTAVRRAERAAVERSTGAGSPHSRTTLSFALARPQQGWWGWASVGDSHVFLIEAAGAHEVGGIDRGARVDYLGSPARVDEGSAPQLRCGRNAIGESQALALATDGLSERGIGVPDPAAAVEAALAASAQREPPLRPLAAARGIVERAIEAQRTQKAGDNICSAVCQLTGEEL